MSTTIDYRREAFYFDRTSQNSSYVDREVLVLTEIGSSNCYDMNNRRARDWQIFAYGSAYGVYGEVARHAAAASGGMLVIGRMGNWSQDYAQDISKVIKAYDKAIKAAAPITAVFERFTIRAEIRITGELEKYTQERLERLAEKRSLVIQEKQGYYGNKFQAADMNITTEEALGDVHRFHNGTNITVVYSITEKGAL